MGIKISETSTIDLDQVLELYQANQWTAAQKPNELFQGLVNAHSLVSAWDGHKLVGLGNAISDGHLVVHYPHLLVHPDYQGQGIGRQIVAKLLEQYQGFHMQILTADEKSEAFYQKVGFSRAGKTIPMWIYKGKEH